MLRAARPGRTGGEVYNLAMAEMKSKGITAMIYSHPIGDQGHGQGAAIDYRTAGLALNDSRNEKLQKGAYLSVELNTCKEVAEWANKNICAMEEDDAYLTEDGYRFFQPRQTEFYLIQPK